MTFTAFEDWRRTHARHHATAGDLDRCGEGDIWTLTVAEYQAAPWRTRLAYRLVRNPFVLLVLGPLRPRIPNYNLQRCYDHTPVLQTVAPLTLRRSLRSLSLNLWDEANHKLVSFRSLKDAQPQLV